MLMTTVNCDNVAAADKEDDRDDDRDFFLKTQTKKYDDDGDPNIEKQPPHNNHRGSRCGDTGVIQTKASCQRNPPTFPYLLYVPWTAHSCADAAVLVAMVAAAALAARVTTIKIVVVLVVVVVIIVEVVVVVVVVVVVIISNCCCCCGYSSLSRCFCRNDIWQQ